MKRLTGKDGVMKMKATKLKIETQKKDHKQYWNKITDNLFSHKHIKNCEILLRDSLKHTISIYDNQYLRNYIIDIECEYNDIFEKANERIIHIILQNTDYFYDIWEKLHEDNI